MTLSRKLLLTAGLLTAACALVEYNILAPQRAELARLQQEADRIAATHRRHRHALAMLEHQLAELHRTAAEARATAAAAEAGSAMRLWAGRIALLKQLLGEMPSQSLPELRLLSPSDWVGIVRNRELDTPENIRHALGAARAMARGAISKLLIEGVTRFAAQSGGMLPNSLGELAAWLPPPADLEMLQRYTLLRTGRLEANDEPIFREADTSDFIAEISYKGGIHLENNLKWKQISGENDASYFARALVALQTLAPPTADADRSMFAVMATYQALMDAFSPKAESLLGRTAGDFIKQSTARFAAEHGKAPTHMGDIVRYFEDMPALMAFARPILAELEYMAEHDGQKPTDPAQLKPYLARPIQKSRLLRNMRLTTEGDTVQMKVNFSPLTDK